MTELQAFAQKHRYFLWWVPDLENVGVDSLIEATLVNGTMEEKKELLQIVGKKDFTKHFHKLTKSRRAKNLEPRTIHYWSLYLSR